MASDLVVQAFLDGSFRDRWGWTNARKSDLIRHVAGVMSAAQGCVDGQWDIDELDRQIKSLEARVQYVREFVRLVKMGAREVSDGGRP